jgi:hypothetical protein
MVLIAKKVRATTFRNQFRRLAARASGRNVILIENRRQKAKYLVDKAFLDGLIQQRESTLATLEVLADPQLAERLITLGKSVDRRVRTRKTRLYSMEEVFTKP